MNAAWRAWRVAALVCAGVVAWRSAAWGAAAAERRGAQRALAQVRAKVQRLAALHAMPPVAGFGARPSDDLLQLAGGTLGAAGLPGSRLRGVQPEPDRTIEADPDGRRVAAARLTLEPVTPAELGRFMAALRAAQRVWSVDRVELVAQGGAAAPGYRATLSLVAPYVREDHLVPRAPGPGRAGALP